MRRRELLASVPLLSASALMHPTSTVAEEQPVSETRRLSDFGCVGDAVVDQGKLVSGTDDTSATQAAFDWMRDRSGRQLFGDPGKTYLITGTIRSSGDLRFNGLGCAFFKTSSGTAFEFTAPLSFYDLSSDYVAGDMMLSVSSTGQPLKPGEPFVVLSDAISPYNRDQGSELRQYRVAEWSIVANGSTPTLIQLQRPLRRVKGQDPADPLLQRASVDEAFVNAFTTTLGARIAKIDFRQADLQDFTLEYETGHGSGATDPWSGVGLYLKGFRGIIEGFRQKRGYDPSVTLVGTVGMVVRNCRAENLENDTSQGFFGYGVADTGWGTIVENCVWVALRHGYKPGPAPSKASEDNYRAVSQTGAQGWTVAHCKGLHCSGTPFDSHAGSFDGTYIAPYAEACDGFGIGIRGRDITVISPTVRNCQGGVSVITDFQGGNENDDNWLAGKSRDHFTSCRIIDPDIECGEEDGSGKYAPFHIRYSTVSIEGKARVRANSHVLIHGNGTVDWDAACDFQVIDFDGTIPLKSREKMGVFTVNRPNNEDANKALPSSVFTLGKGADIRIDMTRAVGKGISVVRVNKSAALINRGHLQAIVAPDARIFDGTGQIEARRDALFEYEVVDAPGTAVTTAATEFTANLQSRDGSVHWKAPLPNGELQQVYAKYNHYPTADTLVLPLQHIQRAMSGKAAGHVRVRQIIQWAGASGAIDLSYESFGTILSTFKMPADGEPVIAETEILMTGPSEWTHLITWDGSGDRTRVSRTMALENLVQAEGNWLSLTTSGEANQKLRIFSTEIWATEGGIA